MSATAIHSSRNIEILSISSARYFNDPMRTAPLPTVPRIITMISQMMERCFTAEVVSLTEAMSVMFIMLWSNNTMS